jgi:hypothetical protein
MSRKQILKNELDVLQQYVRHRCLSNASDPQTDKYPLIWGTIIKILKRNDRWDYKDGVPKPLKNFNGKDTPR